MVRVAVGLLRDNIGRVLVNQRKPDGRHPGRWEFPGGKLEDSESARDALSRELDEELGIDVVDARRRICLHHRYDDLLVELDVWDVLSWRGNVHAREGHRLRWLDISALGEIDLLEADRPIVTSLRLPSMCAVTPDVESWTSRPAQAWLGNLRRQFRDHPVMLHLRLPAATDRQYAQLATELGSLCSDMDFGLMLNGDPSILAGLARRVGAAGIQVPARFVSHLDVARKDAGQLLLGASCHDEAELRQAKERGADFALLGAVNRTVSHSKATPLGWAAFAQLVERANMPVFAIGGVTPDDIETAWSHGAQGVAGISSFWKM